MPPRDAEAYAAAGSEPKEIRWYDHGHAVSDELLRDQAAFLARWIGIDASGFE